MSRQCVRPGCSEAGATEYGMVTDDLLFWIAPLSTDATEATNVLCLRHADAMVVPNGWTLDDRREEVPRLFGVRSMRETTGSAPRRRPVRRPSEGEQLQIDGTGEIERPDLIEPPPSAAREPAEPHRASAARAWTPTFDHASDLGGVLAVSSPLLARAFRGTGRPRD